MARPVTSISTTTKLEAPPAAVALRVALIGNVDAGKSTLVGVLARGALDGGRGEARGGVFQHDHERATGRTSSVGREIMGFDGTGPDAVQVGIISGASTSAAATAAAADGEKELPERSRWAAVMGRCSGGRGAVISLLDLCGHEKYLKTTIFGLTALRPDLAIVAVAANRDEIDHMTREHIGIACSLQVPLCVVLTKVDMAPPPVLKATRAALVRLLRSTCKKPLFVVASAAADDAVAAGGGAAGAAAERAEDPAVLQAVAAVGGGRITPVFSISSVTGAGIDALRAFLRLSAAQPPPSDPWPGLSLRPPLGRVKPPLQQQGQEQAQHQPLSAAAAAAGGRAAIDAVYHVPGIGVVVGAFVSAGQVSAGDACLVGPDTTGAFLRATIRSVQLHTTDVAGVSAGQSATFALRFLDKASKKVARKGRAKHQTAVSKGMVLVSCAQSHARGGGAASLRPPMEVSSSFEANMLVLHHQTTIGVGSEAVIHCGATRQVAKVVHIRKAGLAIKPSADAPAPMLRTGDRACVRFRFLLKPECIPPGSLCLFVQGRTKALGRIMRVVDDSVPASAPA
jgi:GTPase